MARCTAPVRGHHSASAQENCPACGKHRYGSRYGLYSPPSYEFSHRSDGGERSSKGSGSSARPRWLGTNSSVVYTSQEVRSLTPIRSSVEEMAKQPDLELRDVFLCHAWDDRKGVAKDLHDLLESQGVSVWFSEKDVGLGMPLLRAIDKGLENSRIGLVLATPALLIRLQTEGVADKELSVLLSREHLIPIVHDTTYEDLREVSPLLGSRSGLSTAEEPIGDVVTKLTELVTI